MEELPAPRTPESIDSVVKAALFLGVVVFFTCLLGISTRPAGFLASLWPANAVMLGLLLRMPAAAKPLGWLCASAAYVAADTLAGGTVYDAFILNSANIISVATGYWVYLKLPRRAALLREPVAMLYLVLAAAVAACAGGMAGAVVNVLLFRGTALQGGVYWFTTEFVSYIAVLPALLSAPVARGCAEQRTRAKQRYSPMFFAPVLALILSCVLAVLVGGIGAISFAVPALLWCGLSYAIFPTAVLTLLYGLWTLLALGTGLLPDPAIFTNELAAISARLGISLIAIAPVMLATVAANHNDLLARMQHLATRDSLSGALNRGAFFELATKQLLARGAIGTLMIDIDHFKQVNDTYGHAAGDEVIIACAQRIQACLRQDDILGRMGGEEFAVVLQAGSLQETRIVADRILRAIAGSPVAISDKREITTSVSIGIAFSSPPHPVLDDLLAEADQALYTAKQLGRNRVATEHDRIHGCIA